MEALGEQVLNSAQGWIMSIVNPTMQITSLYFQRGQIIAASFFVMKGAEGTDNT